MCGCQLYGGGGEHHLQLVERELFRAIMLGDSVYLLHGLWALNITSSLLSARFSRTRFGSDASVSDLRWEAGGGGGGGGRGSAGGAGVPPSSGRRRWRGVRAAAVGAGSLGRS